MNTPFRMQLPAYGPLAAVKLKSFFFSNSYDASALVMLRIGTGCILLLQFLQLLPDLQSLTGDTSLIRPDISAIEIPPYIVTSVRLTAWINTYTNLAPAAALQFITATYIVSVIFIIAGLLTRISTLICLLLHLAFVYNDHFFSYGVDYFLNIFLFYILIFPVNRAYAADKYVFKLQPVNSTPYIRLLQLHLCIVYFISGLAKAPGINWWNGISIWKAINRPGISGYDLHVLADYAWLFTLTGIATITTEALYIIFINIERTRKLWLTLTCLLHLAIAVVLHLPFFAAVMILFNTVAFYLPQKSKQPGFNSPNINCNEGEHAIADHI